MNEHHFETPYVKLRDKSDQCVSERDLQIKETSCDFELESMPARGLLLPQNRRGEENMRCLEIFSSYLLRIFKQTQLHCLHYARLHTNFVL